MGYTTSSTYFMLVTTKFDLIAANSAGMMSCLLANQNNSQFHHLADETIVNFKQLHQLYSDKQIIK